MFKFLFPKIPQIGVGDIKKAIDNNQNRILLNVRTPQEYAKGHIAKCINIPVDTVQMSVEKSISDKDKKIYVNCLSGTRSVIAPQIIVKLGYKNIHNMTSGLLAWRRKGYQLV